MAEFTFNKNINTSKFLNEILGASFVSKFDYLKTRGNVLSVFTNTTLTVGEETELNGLVASHIPGNPKKITEEKIRKGILIGVSLISKISEEFLSRGLTIAEIGTVASRFTTFYQLLYFGYFQAAKASLSSIPVDSLVPQGIINAIDAEMQRIIDRVA